MYRYGAIRTDLRSVIIFKNAESSGRFMFHVPHKKRSPASAPHWSIPSLLPTTQELASLKFLYQVLVPTMMEWLIVQLARDTERGLHVSYTQYTLHTTTSTIPLALSIKSSTHIWSRRSLSFCQRWRQWKINQKLMQCNGDEHRWRSQDFNWFVQSLTILHLAHSIHWWWSHALHSEEWFKFQNCRSIGTIVT